MVRFVRLPLIGLLIGLLIFAVWFILAIVFEKPPKFFPLNNPEGSYIVRKSSTLQQGWDEPTNASQSTQIVDSSEEAKYFVEYRGLGVLGDEGERNFFSITVANSKVDLEPFINKNVRIKKGEFVTSSKQCIVGKCTDIYGPMVALDIDDIETINK